MESYEYILATARMLNRSSDYDGELKMLSPGKHTSYLFTAYRPDYIIRVLSGKEFLTFDSMMCRKLITHALPEQILDDYESPVYNSNGLPPIRMMTIQDWVRQ